MPNPEIWYLHPFHCPSDHAHSIQILNTCRALAEEGADVHLMVKRNSGQRVKSYEEALQWYDLRPHDRLHLEWLPTFHNGIAGWAARRRIQRSKKGTIFYARHLRLAHSAWKSGCGRVFIELHQVEKELKDIAQNVDGIATITSPLRDRILSLYHPQAPFAVIPDGVDLTKFRPIDGHESPRVVYTGQFHDWKGVDVLLKALVKVESLLGLIIGGKQGFDPQREMLKKLVRDGGIANRVEWAGFLPQKEIRTRLRAGDIGVVPTRAANGQDIAASPLKLFEYMAMGLPIVATDLPSIRDIIVHGKNGLLFEEGNEDSLAKALQTLTNDQQLRLSLAWQAREDARQYSWSKRAQRILEFIT